MTSPETPGVVVEDRGPVRTVRIDRPDHWNSIDASTAAEIAAALRNADGDPSVRAIVLTGTGRWFCTGAHLSGAPGGPAHAFAFADATAVFYDMVRTAWQLTTPMITALNGGVYGVGVALALSADLVVAVRGAVVAQLFAERGLPAHAGDPYVLSRVLPPKRLAEFALLGRRFTVEDLERWGAVNWVVDEEDLQRLVEELSDALASGPTVSLGVTKRLYRRADAQDIESAFLEDAAMLAMAKTTHDFNEGLRAFGERRRPKFEGH